MYELLLYVSFILPAYLFGITRCCCGGAVAACEAFSCGDCPSLPCWQLVVDSVGNGTKSDCTEFNGTWEFSSSEIAISTGGVCNLLLDINDPGGPSIGLIFITNATPKITTIQIQFNNPSGGDVAVYAKTGLSRVCSDTTPVIVPWFSNSGFCTGLVTGTTKTVTPI